MNIHEKANELASLLKDAPEVIDYKRANEKVKVNETSKKMIEDFRKKQIEVYSIQMQGKQPNKEELDAFNNLWNVISLNSDVKEFIEAEMRFSRIWEDIMKILGDAVDLDLSMGLK